jgi:hypothetical protein
VVGKGKVQLLCDKQLRGDVFDGHRKGKRGGLTCWPA